MPTRCTAKAKHTGQQCRAYAIHGTDKCRVHGGMAAIKNTKHA
ncbi:MAG: HGGxSTG domain-containing protein [Desulfotomaculales bacterium]